MLKTLTVWNFALIEFINIDSYEVSKIYDFDHKCKALIKRNYLYNLHLYG